MKMKDLNTRENKSKIKDKTKHGLSKISHFGFWIGQIRLREKRREEKRKEEKKKK